MSVIALNGAAPAKPTRRSNFLDRFAHDPADRTDEAVFVIAEPPVSPWFSMALVPVPEAIAQLNAIHARLAVK
jgi:hypothetical protein